MIPRKKSNRGGQTKALVSNLFYREVAESRTDSSTENMLEEQHSNYTYQRVTQEISEGCYKHCKALTI